MKFNRPACPSDQSFRAHKKGGASLPELYDATSDQELWKAAQVLLLEQALRPSKVVAAVQEFCSSVFGSKFGSGELNCGDVVNQVKPGQPIMLASGNALNDDFGYK